MDHRIAKKAIQTDITQKWQHKMATETAMTGNKLCFAAKTKIEMQIFTDGCNS